MSRLLNIFRYTLRNNAGSVNFNESLALKAVSLLLALILWITILGFKREELKKNVKFEPILPPGMMITNRIPTHITFTFVGPRISLRDVEKKLQPIRMDLRRTRESNIPANISAETLGEMPQGVRIEPNITPNNFTIKLEEVTERYVPVKPTLAGSPADGVEIASVKAIPTKVAVSGAKSLVQALEYVGTEAIDVQDLSGAKSGVFAVEVDTNQGFQLSRDKVVNVHIMTRKVEKK